MKIQVGVISYKPGEMLQRCLDGLVRVQAGIDYELVLQLTEGSNAENWNRLMERCDADFICILEDDTAPLKPFWLKSLVEPMKTWSDAGIIMPIETKDGQHEDPGFTRWLNTTTEVEQTYGFCNLIRREIGLKADEKLTYYVDIDLALQARAKGWKCLCNGHVWMLHGNQNGGRMSDDPGIKEVQASDMKYLQEKWGIKDWKEG